MMAHIISSWVFSWLDLKTGNKSEYSISNPYPEAYFQPIQTSVMELLGENSYQFKEYKYFRQKNAIANVRPDSKYASLRSHWKV